MIPGIVSGDGWVSDEEVWVDWHFVGSEDIVGRSIFQHGNTLVHHHTLTSLCLYILKNYDLLLNFGNHAHLTVHTIYWGSFVFWHCFGKVPWGWRKYAGSNVLFTIIIFWLAFYYILNDHFKPLSSSVAHCFFKIVELFKIFIFYEWKIITSF